MNSPKASAEKAHAFLYNLVELLNGGVSSDEVWNYCIENAQDAKRALNVTLNHYQKRCDTADELVES